MLFHVIYLFIYLCIFKYIYIYTYLLLYYYFCYILWYVGCTNIYVLFFIAIKIIAIYHHYLFVIRNIMIMYDCYLFDN